MAQDTSSQRSLHSWLMIIALVVVGGTTATALDTVPVKPMSQLVSTAIKPCSPSPKTRVPLITWGGDIPTIVANGGKSITTPESIFGKKGLSLELVREDVFSQQVAAFLRCDSPYLRGTVGMIAMAAEVANRDPRTSIKVIYQLTWSAGGDALVVKSDRVRAPADLKGKRIALQAYGPHVDYLGKVLSDAGLSMKDVTPVWMKDLTGTSQTPGVALGSTDVDAALVIIPDALALTSGGTVGTGAENSIKGAKILLSTKSANRVIADVYGVRSDFFDQQRTKVEAFVNGLLQAQEQVRDLFKNQDGQRSQYTAMVSGAASLLLDSAEAVEDTAGMYGDAEFAGLSGNIDFFTKRENPRGFERVSMESQSALVASGLLGRNQPILFAGLDFGNLKSGLKDTGSVPSARFDEAEVAKVVSKRQQQGTLDASGLFSFEVFFKPNQSDFSAGLYEEAFRKAIDLAATYGGAVLTVEGHTDPLQYLEKKKANAPEVALRQIRQSAKNLSLRRAESVRDSLLAFAKKSGIELDPSQFAIVGHGIDRPRSGLCGSDPCPPKTEQEWLNNMRVEFRIIQVEAESSVFRPL